MSQEAFSSLTNRIASLEDIVRNQAHSFSAVLQRLREVEQLVGNESKVREQSQQQMHALLGDRSRASEQSEKLSILMQNQNERISSLQEAVRAQQSVSEGLGHRITTEVRGVQQQVQGDINGCHQRLQTIESANAEAARGLQMQVQSQLTVLQNTEARCRSDLQAVQQHCDNSVAAIRQRVEATEIAAQGALREVHSSLTADIKSMYAQIERNMQAASQHHHDAVQGLDARTRESVGALHQQLQSELATLRGRIEDGGAELRTMVTASHATLAEEVAGIAHHSQTIDQRQRTAHQSILQELSKHDQQMEGIDLNWRASVTDLNSKTQSGLSGLRTQHQGIQQSVQEHISALQAQVHDISDRMQAKLADVFNTVQERSILPLESARADLQRLEDRLAQVQRDGSATKDRLQTFSADVDRNANQFRQMMESALRASYSDLLDRINVVSSSHTMQTSLQEVHAEMNSALGKMWREANSSFTTHRELSALQSELSALENAVRAEVCALAKKGEYLERRLDETTRPRRVEGTLSGNSASPHDTASLQPHIHPSNTAVFPSNISSSSVIGMSTRTPRVKLETLTATVAKPDAGEDIARIQKHLAETRTFPPHYSNTVKGTMESQKSVEAVPADNPRLLLTAAQSTGPVDQMPQTDAHPQTEPAVPSSIKQTQQMSAPDSLTNSELIPPERKCAESAVLLVAAGASPSVGSQSVPSASHLQTQNDSHPPEESHHVHAAQSSPLLSDGKSSASSPLPTSEEQAATSIPTIQDSSLEQGDETQYSNHSVSNGADKPQSYTQDASGDAKPSQKPVANNGGASNALLSKCEPGDRGTTPPSLVSKEMHGSFILVGTTGQHPRTVGNDDGSDEHQPSHFSVNQGHSPGLLHPSHAFVRKEEYNNFKEFTMKEIDALWVELLNVRQNGGICREEMMGSIATSQEVVLKGVLDMMERQENELIDVLSVIKTNVEGLRANPSILTSAEASYAADGTSRIGGAMPGSHSELTSLAGRPHPEPRLPRVPQRQYLPRVPSHDVSSTLPSLNTTLPTMRLEPVSGSKENGVPPDTRGGVSGVITESLSIDPANAGNAHNDISTVAGTAEGEGNTVPLEIGTGISSPQGDGLAPAIAAKGEALRVETSGPPTTVAPLVAPGQPYEGEYSDMKGLPLVHLYDVNSASPYRAKNASGMPHHLLPLPQWTPVLPPNSGRRKSNDGEDCDSRSESDDDSPACHHYRLRSEKRRKTKRKKDRKHRKGDRTLDANDDDGGVLSGEWQSEVAQPINFPRIRIGGSPRDRDHFVQKPSNVNRVSAAGSEAGYFAPETMLGNPIRLPISNYNSRLDSSSDAMHSRHRSQLLRIRKNPDVNLRQGPSSDLHLQYNGRDGDQKRIILPIRLLHPDANPSAGDTLDSRH